MKHTYFLIPALLFFLASFAAHGFRLSPMVSIFAISGENASQVFVIENNQKERVALEMAVFVRKVDEFGKEERIATADFSVYPEQMILESEEKRNLRVTYLGLAAPSKEALITQQGSTLPTGSQLGTELVNELAYRLVVSQIPVDLKKPEENKVQGPKVAINFLLQYVASLYVSPANAFPIISIDSFQAVGKDNGLLVIKNSGTAHKVLEGLNVKILPSEKNSDAVSNTKKQVRKPEIDWTLVSVNQESLKSLQSENILAGNIRRFEIKFNQQIPEGPVSAKLELLSTPAP